MEGRGKEQSDFNLVSTVTAYTTNVNGQVSEE